MSATAQDGNRWARITPDDRSGILYIVALLAFIYTSLTFLTRIFIRRRMLGLDDLAMLIAQVASVTQFSLLLVSLSSGLAQTFERLDSEQYSRMASTYSHGQVFIYICLGFSKIALVLLVRRLFTRDMKRAWAICNVVIGIMVTWTLVSAVLVSASCTKESLSPRKPSDVCHGIETRYMIIIVTDGITDLALAFIPTYLCRDLQMKTTLKLEILGIFSLRLPLLMLAGLFYQTWRSSLRGENPGVERTTALIYQQSHLCVSLIAGTLPCLNSFIRSFDTGSGQKVGVGNSADSGGYGHMSSVHHSTTQSDHSESLPMSRFDRVQSVTSRKRRHASEGAVSVNRKPYIAESSFEAHDTGGNLERMSTRETNRRSQHSTQELFIRKDVYFEVKREPVPEGMDAHQPGQLHLPK